MNKISSIKRAKAGRPTKEQAEARHELLLDRAIDHFLDKGFERTTVEAIAADVNMTKRTVYTRYPDKSALFHAALRRAATKQSVSPADIEENRAATVEQTLTNIAKMRVEQVSTPRGLKMQRLIDTESYRFPDIFLMTYELRSLPTIRFLEKLFREETEAGRLAIEQPERTALVFMSMVVSGPVQFITSGNPLSPDELDERIAFAVRLFLEGAKPR